MTCFCGQCRVRRVNLGRGCVKNGGVGRLGGLLSV